MSKSKNSLHRPYGELSYRKIFVIAVEGEKTEKEYFSIFQSLSPTVCIRFPTGKSHSSPYHVLERMKKYLKDCGLGKTDEAWLVVDKDQWSDEQLNKLCDWAQTRENYGFALSNPKFEYWLLLHFENGEGIASARDCGERLRKHIPEYSKGINPRKFTADKIEAAINRAKQRDNPPCQRWPHNPGGTTVYKLVERIFIKNPDSKSR